MKGGVHIRLYIILHLINSIYDYYIAKKQVDFSNKKLKIDLELFFFLRNEINSKFRKKLVGLVMPG